jgi:hypothetical protein
MKDKPVQDGQRGTGPLAGIALVKASAAMRGAQALCGRGQEERLLKRGSTMRKAAVVPVIARLKAGRPGTVAALVRVWGRGTVVAVLLTLSLVLLGEGAPGDLDPTFGVGGKVTTDFAGLGLHDEASALVLQPDGKLVAAGVFNTSGSGDFSLARYVEQQPVFNDFVSFEPLPATFHFTPDPTGCPEGFVGTFSFEARLTNISERTLSDLVIEVIALTGNHLLQNADGGPGGVGAHLTVPRQDGFTEGRLTPDEFVDVPFIICLRQKRPFRLVVDVLGETE